MYQSDLGQVTTYSHGDGVRVLVMAGEFDLATVAPFRDAVQAALADDCAIILEMSGTTFIDSTTLGIISSGHTGCERRRRSLQIVAPRPHVRRVLQLMALDTVIGIRPTLAAALAEDDAAVPSLAG